MATAQTEPAAGKVLAGETSIRQSPSAEAAAEQALVPCARQPEEGPEFAHNREVARLPVELDVAVPVRDFRVRQLLALTPGQLIESKWSHEQDVPLAAGDVLLAWSEFEVVETQLMVRVTRMA